MNLIPLQQAGSSPPWLFLMLHQLHPLCLASDHLATMFGALPLLQEDLRRLEAKFTAGVFFKHGSFFFWISESPEWKKNTTALQKAQAAQFVFRDSDAPVLGKLQLYINTPCRTQLKKWWKVYSPGQIPVSLITSDTLLATLIRWFLETTWETWQSAFLTIVVLWTGKHGVGAVPPSGLWINQYHKLGGNIIKGQHVLYVLSVRVSGPGF